MKCGDCAIWSLRFYIVDDLREVGFAGLDGTDRAYGCASLLDAG